MKRIVYAGTQLDDKMQEDCFYAFLHIRDNESSYTKKELLESFEWEMTHPSWYGPEYDVGQDIKDWYAQLSGPEQQQFLQDMVNKVFHIPTKFRVASRLVRYMKNNYPEEMGGTINTNNGVVNLDYTNGEEAVVFTVLVSDDLQSEPNYFEYRKQEFGYDLRIPRYISFSPELADAIIRACEGELQSPSPKTRQYTTVRF